MLTCLDNLPVVYVTYVDKTIRSNAGEVQYRDI